MEQLLNPENIESEIAGLLAELESYVLDQFPPETQDELASEWYDTEMEALVGADRNAAFQYLSKFVEKIKNLPKKER